MSRIFHINHAIVSLFLMVIASVANACPCGCGSADPMTMYPGETWKYALTMTRSSDFKTVTKSGEQATDAGPEIRTLVDLGISYAWTQDLSTAVNVPVEQNTALGETDSALADPTLSMRYTASRYNFAQPIVPQVQLLGSYKYAQGRSIYDEFEKERQLDIHSNGFAEYTGAADLKWQQESWQVGLRQSVIYFGKKTFEQEDSSFEIEPGIGRRTVGQIGYTFIGTGQLMAAVGSESRNRLKTNGVTINDSEKHTNTAAMIGNLRVGDRKTASLSLSRTAAFGNNKNTTRGDSIAFGFLQAI